MKFKLRYLIAGTILFLIAVIMYPDGSCRIVKKAEAQEKVKKVVIQSKYLKYEPNEIVLYEISVSNDTLTMNRAIAAICVLDLLKEYAAECYEDSDYVEYHPVLTDSSGRFAYGIYITAHKWIHKEPTLPGFIKFLDKRFAGVK